MPTKALHRALWIVLFTVAVPAAFAARPMKPAEPKKETRVSENAEASRLYEEGEKAADKEDFSTALKRFRAADELDPDNADILNMLAYSQRKTGDLDTAIENYRRALKLRPEFPEAREYLGEAYVQAALRELETLRGYGAKARHEAEELAEAIEQAASGL